MPTAILDIITCDIATLTPLCETHAVLLLCVTGDIGNLDMFAPLNGKMNDTYCCSGDMINCLLEAATLPKILSSILAFRVITALFG